MGKRKIEMRKIENKNAKQVCFSKSRQGPFKKAKELSILCGVDIAILTFSPAGRLFSFANTDIVSILDCYCKENYQCCPTSTITTSNGEGGDNFWWEKVNVEELDKGEELRQLRKSLQDVRGKVASRTHELSSASSSLPSLIPSSSDLTTCAKAEDVKWPPLSLDHLSRPCLMGDESAAYAMNTAYVVEVEAPPLPLLQHDGVMQVESSSLDFAKHDDDGLMMPIFGGEDCDDVLMKPILEEKDDDWLMMMSVISGPSTQTDFDDIFPSLKDQGCFGSSEF